MSLSERVRTQAARQRARIVLPEAADSRVRRAAEVLSGEGLAEPLLLDAAVLAEHRAALEAIYVPLRTARGESTEKARADLDDPLLAGAVMVRAGLADGCLAGAVASTAATLRAALRGIGTAPGIRWVSSYMLLDCPHADGGRRVVVVADCAVIPEPDAEQLATIAANAADNAALFLTEPVRMAFLSADAAYDDLANVLVFPNLDAANIGHKLVARLGGASVLGPVLQGLALPMNDLSRGADVDEIVDLACITAIQAAGAA